MTQSTVEDLGALVESVRARNLALEGVEVVLVLEDLAGGPHGEARPQERAEGEELARLGATYHERLRADAPEAGVYVAVEVLAAGHFRGRVVEA